MILFLLSMEWYEIQIDKHRKLSINGQTTKEAGEDQ